VKAGFTMFTVDPSEHIDDSADEMKESELKQRFDGLFSDASEKRALVERYVNRNLPCDMEFSEEDVVRESCKYLPAARHVVSMFRHLKKVKETGFDFEVSIDETEKPSSPKSHFFIVTELLEQGVEITGLAPRFPGDFQKAIDYIGNVDEFEQELRKHADIARELGGYKISVHSGSDKFSIFPIVGRVTGGLFHEKTAGTSYLEAIRVIAREEPGLYRQIHEFALENFGSDRKLYHVTTDVDAVPDIKAMSDDTLETLLDDDNARQVIHITYRSVLTTRDDKGDFLFRKRIMDVLDENEEGYYQGLDKHLSRHIESFKK